MNDMSNEPGAQCPVMHDVDLSARVWGMSNQLWWPNQLNLRVLHQNTPETDPHGETFNYAEAFKSLDFEEVKKDVIALMTNSVEWWPA
ncbi:MAG: catalase-peroxidase, partial [Pseudomonadota bacterium]